MLNGRQVLDRYFPEVRAWLIQIAAVMDRLDRAEGNPPPSDDLRLKRFQESLKVLSDKAPKGDRTERIQKIFSDPVS